MITAVFSYLFVVLEILNHLPRPAKQIVAGILTRFFYLSLPGLRRDLDRNLTRVLPEASAAERRRTARRLVNNYGQYFIDYFGVFFARRLPRSADYFSEMRGEDNLREVLAQGNGMFLITPHLGNWELGLLVLESCRERVAILTAPMASANMRRKQEAFRRRLGVEVVTLGDPAGYFFELKRLLAEKKIITLLADRYVGGSGAEIPFFGQPTRVPTGYLHLARMFDAPVLPCFIIRKPDGTYACLAETPICVSRAGDRDADVEEAARQVAAVFERYIRQYVDQWYYFTALGGAS